MQARVTTIIEHMAKSHGELAEIIESTRYITVNMAQIIEAIPDVQINFQGVEALTQHSLGVTKNLTSYLNILADLEEAIADNLSILMKELNPADEE
ncbi:nucleoside-diphosphate sugar epimerase [Paenibacillus sp. J2TS4]|uniref:nucleoside-diphosphate sugar epimerase n=1 Tax=Paenibacillus sp. J2TS4 TaxID=2807194 RepID=UPI001B29753B|nr:nucleoside-diphosphate sugar epimerase [Paenibacillus sp. J2TS4]GIP31302.1 hypothetical protein J2TS4_05120 [Paenibacillus sp. J2TS4]